MDVLPAQTQKSAALDGPNVDSERDTPQPRQHVASLQPPPPMKEPPQMRYSPGRFRLTAQMSGEFRVTIMAS